MEIKSIGEYIKKPINWSYSKISPRPRQERIDETEKESRPKGEGKEINFKDIESLLNYYKKGDEGFLRRAERQERIKEVEKFIDENNFKGYIEITDSENSEDSEYNEYLRRKISLMSPGCKITFQNLRIKGPYYGKINMTSSVFAYAVFKNNYLFYDNESIKSFNNNPQKEFKAKDYFPLSEYFGVKLQNNRFIDVGLSLISESERYPEDKYAKGNPNKFIIIEDNIIPFIYSSVYTSIYFKGCNIIKRIDIYNKNLENKFDVSWSMHQEIDLDEEFYITNKEFFIALKKVAVEKNDKSQEAMINREILRCDEKFIRNEEDIKDSWQDRFVLWFGKVTSNHGVSWLRPLLILLGLNTGLTLIIFVITIIGYLVGIANFFIGWKIFYIWIEMFNPISNLANTTGMDNFIISSANVVQKGVFAVLIYEFIRVGRRFVAK